MFGDKLAAPERDDLRMMPGWSARWARQRLRRFSLQVPRRHVIKTKNAKHQRGPGLPHINIALHTARRDDRINQRNKNGPRYSLGSFRLTFSLFRPCWPGFLASFNILVA